MAVGQIFMQIIYANSTKFWHLTGGFGSNNETRHVLYTAQGHMIYVAEEGSLRKRIRKGLEFQEHLRDSVGNGLLLHRPASVRSVFLG